MPELPHSIIVADVGNSFLKVGRFPNVGATSIPTLGDPLECAKDEIADLLRDWLPNERCHWFVSSVNREMEGCLSQWLRRQRDDRYTLLTSRDVPIPIRVDSPQQVGMDRLAAAVTANRLRKNGQAAIVIDAGSAITVDVVSCQGEFLGGAILPGLTMSASALSTNTDLLPFVPASYRDDPPELIGRSTQAAMRSGLYWGTVGAVKELVGNFASHIEGDAIVVISGGAAELLKDRLELVVCYVPHIVLVGLVLIAHSKCFEK